MRKPQFVKFWCMSRITEIKHQAGTGAQVFGFSSRVLLPHITVVLCIEHIVWVLKKNLPSKYRKFQTIETVCKDRISLQNFIYNVRKTYSQLTKFSFLEQLLLTHKPPAFNIIFAFYCLSMYLTFFYIWSKKHFYFVFRQHFHSLTCWSKTLKENILIKNNLAYIFFTLYKT